MLFRSTKEQYEKSNVLIINDYDGDIVTHTRNDLDTREKRINSTQKTSKGGNKYFFYRSSDNNKRIVSSTKNISSVNRSFQVYNKSLVISLDKIDVDNVVNKITKPHGGIKKMNAVNNGELTLNSIDVFFRNQSELNNTASDLIQKLKDVYGDDTIINTSVSSKANKFIYKHMKLKKRKTGIVVRFNVKTNE